MRAAFEQLRQKVALESKADLAPLGHVLLGLGDPQSQEAQIGLILNQKGQRMGVPPARSLTEYVCCADQATVDSWRLKFPGGLASIQKIVVEDLSFDTCFALYAFVAKLLGRSKVEEHPELGAWIEYVCDWEQGYFTDEDAVHSPACLMSLLGHAFLSKPGDGIGDGLQACLALLEGLLSQDCGPHRVQFPLGIPEYRQAVARFELEYQRYLLALQHGTRCQLSLPLNGSNEKVLADALLLEEVEPSAILKVIARTDRINTWTRNGFGLLGFYRPSAAGTGNDMTVSVDPEMGLSLEGLWKRLEALEDKRWEGHRPTDHPRMIESNRDPANPTTTRPGSPNEPWWDDGGRYTLVAAPKSLGPGVPGSKLEWRRDVLAALWDLYAPIPVDAKAQPKTTGRVGAGAPENLGPALLDGGKLLQYVRWERAANLSVAQSPTFKAWLAAQSMNLAIRSPMDLIQEDEFRVLSAPGGGIFLHREGLTIFDDWTSKPLPEKELQAIASDMAESCGILANFLDKELPKSGLELLSKLRAGQFRREELEAWQEDLMEGKSELLKVFALSIGSLGMSTRAAPTSALLAPILPTTTLQSATGERLRAELSVTWGIAAQRTHVSELLEQLDQLNREMAEEIKERRTRSFALWGSFLGVFIGVKELGETILGLLFPEREWSLLVWLGRGTKSLEELFRQDASLAPIKQSFEKLHHLEYGLFGIALGAALLAVYLAKRLGASIGPKE